MSIAVTALTAILLQSTPLDLPAEPFEPELSAELRWALEQRDESDPEEFVQELEELGDAGDLSALELLGEMHQLSLYGVSRDIVRACDYFERIGNRRADALHNMATCYFAGEGREQDWPRARELYRAAAEAGFIQSRCALGNMLVRGEGGPVESEVGIALCRSGAETGDANALTDLGGYLLMGQGVERDPVEARELLIQAAEQEQANACYLLGQIYQKGDGIEADQFAAKSWFECAHAGGRPDAAYQLMTSNFRLGYRKSGEQVNLVPEWLEEAVGWARIAAKSEPNPDRRKFASDGIPDLEFLVERARQGN